MLLLLVLSILALFLVIGALGILIALRARETARAFASAMSSEGDVAALARTKLDEALLKLIRGPSTDGVTESLLEDKYGQGVSCTTGTTLPGITNGFFTTATGTVPVTGLDLSNPAVIAGRVLTFVPRAGDPTGPTSYRILGVGSAANTVIVANVKPRTPLPLPSILPCDVVVNGREFTGQGTNEPFDAFDNPLALMVNGSPVPTPNEPPVRPLTNAFLTVPGADVVVDPTGPPGMTLNSGTVTIGASSAIIGGTSLNSGTHTVWPFLFGSTIPKVVWPAFSGTANFRSTVDNDGDGTPDGVWLENIFPPQRSANGGQFTFSASYLVLELDGRVNLNAHDSFIRAQVPQDVSQYPQYDPRPYRPIIPTAPGANGPSIEPNPDCLPLGMGFGPADVDASLLLSTTAELASGTTPLRWATLLRGGVLTRNATTSAMNQWRPTPRDQPSQPGRYTSGVSFATAAPGLSDVVATATTGMVTTNADYWMRHPFAPNSPTDLKSQLQVFTSGGNPPTLMFARPQSGTWALTVTDTTDIVSSGTNTHPYAMRLDNDAPRAAGSNAADSLFTIGELERILRPFDSDAGTLAPRLASMLDDRAECSRMMVTTDSWDTPAITGGAAENITAPFGANASSVLSPETIAGLRFNLNRPLVSEADRQAYFRQLYCLLRGLQISGSDAAQWAANVCEFRDTDSVMTWYRYANTPFAGWTTDSGVWGAERPEVVITETSTTSEKLTIKLYRPWQAKCVGSNTVVTEQIDPKLAGGGFNTLNLTGSSGSNAVWQLRLVGSATVGLATLLPSGTALQTNTGTSGTLSISGSVSSVGLWRLANPTGTFNDDQASSSYNDYVLVHSVPSTSNASVARWLHWPNRDFVSHGELLAVQSGSVPSLAAVLLDSDPKAPSEASLARSFPAILDSTIVPSRFLGANVSVANAATNLAGTGLENWQHSHFSHWREPGRVNVNTIPANIGHAWFAPNPPDWSRVHLDDMVWTALIGVSGTFNPVGVQIVRWPSQGSSGPVVVSSTYTPARTAGDLLVKDGDAIMPRSTSTAASAFLKRAPAIRLASCATTRSHVFAVWITLRITDSVNPDTPHYARLFAIVDRSIPVGYSPGRNLNVRDTILLQRFLP